MVDVKKILTLFKIYKDSILYLSLVIFISICLGYLFSFFLKFNENALQVAASAIFQGFGALLAIIISISLYLIKIITNNVERAMRNVSEYLDRTIVVNTENMPEVHRMLDQIINEPRRIARTTEINVENLKKRMIPILVPISFLIISSLIILIFTYSYFDFKYPFSLISTNMNIDRGVLISCSMFYLIITSIYCLFLLVREIKRLLTYEVRENQ